MDPAQSIRLLDDVGSVSLRSSSDSGDQDGVCQESMLQPSGRGGEMSTHDELHLVRQTRALLRMIPHGS